MFGIYSDRATYLLNSAGSGAGSALDTRLSLPYGFLQWCSPAQSAIITLQAAIGPTAGGATGWFDVLQVTATSTTGTAQTSAFYPFVRGVVNAIYSGGGTTGAAYLYFAPGMG